MATTRSTIKCLRLLRVFALLVAICIIYVIHMGIWSVKIRSTRELHPFRMVPDPIIGKPCHLQVKRDSLMSQDGQPSKILYLLQTEECLPSHLRLALGDSALCQCDVAVLSYVNTCNDTSLPHVKYLFNPNTTWTTGRNLLYYTYIYNKSERYLYYIMMDDDVEVMWRDRWKVIGTSITL